MADTDPSARVVEGPKAAGALMDLRLLPLLALAPTREQAKAMQHELHAFAEAWRTVSLRNGRQGAGEPTRDILFGTGMAPE